LHKPNAKRETKKLTAWAQQNSSLSPPRQQNAAKAQQETSRAQPRQKTVQARHEIKK
jgi:hypothetical protein